MRKEVGKRLRIFRDTKELTQQDLAGSLGITRLTVTRYELGQLSLGAESLERLATVYGLNITWLLTGIGSMFFKVDEELSSPPELQELCHYLTTHPDDVKLLLKLVHGKNIADEALEEIKQNHQRKLKHKPA